MSETALTRPQLAPGVRLHWDRVRERQTLLYPEGALTLNQTAVDVLELCDGARSLDEIAGVLSEKYGGADVRADVGELLAAIAERGLVVDASA
ncbi:MAG TPA: pyrroloquinoline quinone biosynthesis peptide chaperone PqqD [Conexibacter sp.]|jgi:pyrroloquinoline quinone biosynthesis protein D